MFVDLAAIDCEDGDVRLGTVPHFVREGLLEPV
jgi:hypothetical protein